MITKSEQKQLLLDLFPFLADASAEFQKIFFDAAIPAHIPAGHTIAETGSECSQLALVISGSVRVYKLAAKGREITLYRIKDGDSCVLTASCLMSATPFPAIAEAETEIDAIIIPAEHAKTWMTQYQPWGNFVFALISRRLSEVITVLENVTFQRMEVRLAAYLVKMTKQQPNLNITHHEIAADLGTSREVVSRSLKDFDKHGWISMGRGELTIKDMPQLQNLAEEI
ncbi:MAG TPA: Crp/Fnr family transcriptional regulator [Gammaproteobacteria bacterium]|nr:Crp/Fnr family transcriptional regulator [Gammaproteobacteria bacterium]